MSWASFQGTTTSVNAQTAVAAGVTVTGVAVGQLEAADICHTPPPSAIGSFK